MSTRRSFLDASQPGSVMSRVRLSAPDLRVVLRNASAMARDFFPPRVLARMTRGERESFWESRQLARNDWLGLASGLLAEFFSREFLTPLHEQDTTFSLKVRGHVYIREFEKLY